ncbi:PLPP1-like protein, partial [Mya arenaria]
AADELGFCVRGYGVFLVGLQLQQLIVEFVKNPSGFTQAQLLRRLPTQFYIQRWLHVSFSRIVKLFLQFGLVFLLLICGLSCIHDNMHHPADVIVGFVVGLSTAILVFQLVGDKLLTSGKQSGVFALQSTDELQNCCS